MGPVPDKERHKSTLFLLSTTRGHSEKVAIYKEEDPTGHWVCRRLGLELPASMRRNATV